VPNVGWFLAAGLVFSRLMGMFVTMPVFSLRGAPALPRALAALMIAAILTPVVPDAPVQSTLAMYIGGMTSELLLGSLIGGTVRIIFDALALAGQLIGSQTGQAAALQFDPTLNIAQGPIGRLSALLAAALFLGSDLHLQMLLALGDSFHHVPPGGATDVIGASRAWIGLGEVMIITGFRLASPIIVLVFLINLFIAVVTRLSPQMNIFFSMGFILTIFGGEFIFLLSLPHILSEHQSVIRAVMDIIPTVLQDAAPGP
jgi:flagellar biosynthetic protein FliR